MNLSIVFLSYVIGNLLADRTNGAVNRLEKKLSEIQDKIHFRELKLRELAKLQSIIAVIKNAADLILDSRHLGPHSETEDHITAKRLIINFVDAVNELFYLRAKNEQAHEYCSHEYCYQNGINSPLKESMILIRQIDRIEFKCLSKSPETGDIRSLYDLGFSFRKNMERGDSFNHNKLEIIDVSWFNNAFEFNFQNVKKFLINKPGIINDIRELAGAIDNEGNGILIVERRQTERDIVYDKRELFDINKKIEESMEDMRKGKINLFLEEQKYNMHMQFLNQFR
eukprot:GHVL01020279.1.p1 GENE.GHVL01020279.1~~GHVL01020279.1.p1  ORF type:complete len:283 (+),score=41.74 GHVL01020279.1:42-890(+)